MLLCTTFIRSTPTVAKLFPTFPRLEKGQLVQTEASSLSRLPGFVNLRTEVLSKKHSVFVVFVRGISFSIIKPK